MKKGIVLVGLSLFLGGCTFTTDEGYINCIQALNTVGSGVRAPDGDAIEVIGAGAVGAGAALVLCDEPDVYESPEVLSATVSGDLSRPIESREPLLLAETEPLVIPPITGFVFDSRTLQFDLDRAELGSGAGETLAPVVEFLNDFPDVSVRITGHTCWLGSEAHNLDLSERRANAVADYLVEQGIDRERLYVSAEGESQPINTNLTEEGRRSNRRVEVVQL
jgi:outer membrane protein OmpA-like peptidoglycan-associated protein